MEEQKGGCVQRIRDLIVTGALLKQYLRLDIGIFKHILGLKARVRYG